MTYLLSLHLPTGHNPVNGCAHTHTHTCTQLHSYTHSHDTCKCTHTHPSTPLQTDPLGAITGIPINDFQNRDIFPHLSHTGPCVCVCVCVCVYPSVLCVV